MAPEQPDYGPRGYLPPRAARRARKIILREPLGLQWAIAAVVAGLAVLAAGVLLLTARAGPPAAPFVAVGDLAQVDPRGAGRLSLTAEREILVVRASGGVTVLAAPDTPVEWCGATDRLVAAGAAVWLPDGRRVGGAGPSLARLPAQVHDGVLYVDATAAGAAADPAPRDESPTCDPATG